jgi:hypothetical protein
MQGAYKSGLGSRSDTDANVSAGPVLVTAGGQVGCRQKNVVSVTCAF